MYYDHVKHGIHLPRRTLYMYFLMDFIKIRFVIVNISLSRFEKNILFVFRLAYNKLDNSYVASLK